MQYLNSANVVGDQLNDQPRGNLVQSGGRILSNDSTHSNGTSHICKDKWRTRANQKAHTVIRKVLF
jgi:hypothetical protein